MKDSVKITLALLPIILLIILFFIYPIIITFDRSLDDINGNYIGFERYGALFANPEFTDAFWYTVQISVISTVISSILAIVIAFALRESFIGKKITLFLYQTNISLPHIAMGAMVLMLLSQTGLISSIAYHLGFIETWSEFPKFVEGYSPFGVIISYTLKFTPFIGMAVLAILVSFARDYEDQSATLGIGKIRTIFHITLPAIKPAIYSTAMIVFCFAFGSYDVPTLLGRSETLSMMAYNAYNSTYNPAARYDGYAISMVIAAITLTITAIYLYISFSAKKEVKR